MKRSGKIRLKLDYAFRMDGEVILHLFNKFGMEKTLQLLDGVFAVCIFDTEAKKIHIGRDTFGVRPLFTVLTDGGELGISSEAKGLMNLSIREDNKASVTPFRPGRYATFDVNTVTGKVKLVAEEQYTDIDSPQTFDISVNLTSEIKENVRLLFTEAVRKRLMSERRIGCLLSGGLDSSLVAAIVVKLARQQGYKYPIQTFSTGLAGSIDLVYAKQVADMLGTEHHEVVFTPEEAFKELENVIYTLESYCPGNVRCAFFMYMLCRYIRQNTDTVVLFSGEGADELAQGYPYFHKAPNDEEAHEDGKRLLRNLYFAELLRADRCVAAHGLELRVPFLDKVFTAYYLSLPKDMIRPKNGIEKHLLRSSFDGHLSEYIPASVLWRRKEGFSDGVSPLETSWASLLIEHCKKFVGDEELGTSEMKYQVNTPETLEQLHYRNVFESTYKDQVRLQPTMWKPKWIGNFSDISGRAMFEMFDDVN